MQTESSPLTFSTSPSEATSIMRLFLASIQSGKILIFVQYPGNSHHPDQKRKKKNYRHLSPVESNVNTESRYQFKLTDSHSGLAKALNVIVLKVIGLLNYHTLPCIMSTFLPEFFREK